MSQFKGWEIFASIFVGQVTVSEGLEDVFKIQSCLFLPVRMLKMAKRKLVKSTIK